MEIITSARKDLVWANFVKEGLSCDSYIRNYNETNRVKLSGPEAKSVYENVIKVNSCTRNNKPQSNVSDYPSKPRTVPKVDFNVNSFLSAAQNNNVSSLVDMLESHPDKINCTDLYGWTALMCASQAGCSDAVEFLIENGADIKIVDNIGRNAYSIAKHAKHKCITKSLRHGKMKKNVFPEHLKIIPPKEELCQLCQESTNNIDLHLLSIEHNLKKNMPTFRRLYGLPATNKGYQLMLKSGWNVEKGLGPNGEGDKLPVKTALKLNTSGFGFEKLKPKVTHFKANDTSAIQPVFSSVLKHQDRRKQAEKRLRERRMEIQFRKEFA